ncbi:MAG: HEAT repeat domain-containing protein [Myxococcaceae bacterium]|nr:HEAT repeat domain-containing protein [Myxococcaceae bacterium]
MALGPSVVAIAMTMTPSKVVADDGAAKADRITAAKALGSSTDKGAVDALLKALDTRNEELRDACIASLAKLNGASVLAARLGDKKQPERTRAEAARGLRFLEDASTVPALIAALSDSSAAVRSEAALALSLFGTEQALPKLVACLDDEDKDVRYYAADALGSVKSTVAKAALEKRLAVESAAAVKYALKVALDKQGR